MTSHIIKILQLFFIMEFWDPPLRPSKIKEFKTENHWNCNGSPDKSDKDKNINFIFPYSMTSLVLLTQSWRWCIEIWRVYGGVTRTTESRIFISLNFTHFWWALSPIRSGFGEWFYCCWIEELLLINKQVFQNWDPHKPSRDWGVFMGNFWGFASDKSGNDTGPSQGKTAILFCPGFLNGFWYFETYSSKWIFGTSWICPQIQYGRQKSNMAAKIHKLLFVPITLSQIKKLFLPFYHKYSLTTW